MKPICTRLIVLALAGTAFSAASNAQIFASDSFESGDLSITPGGISWGSTNNSSLVRTDPVLGDLVIFDDDRVVEIQQGNNGSYKTKEGKVAMRFVYEAGVNSWSEQRFDLDQANKEVWLSYWLRVPTNFRHGDHSPTNNKLFTLWMDDYSSKGDGPTVIWEFWNDGNGGSKLAYHYSEGGYVSANSHKQQTQFIRYPQDQGRWMQIVLHVKAASSRGANDGIIETYRRWENESDFSKLHSDHAADIAPPPGGPNGWKAGYVMGWSNPGYSQRTEWLVDDLRLSTSSLLEGGQTQSPAPVTPEAPGGSTGSCKAPRIPVIHK